MPPLGRSESEEDKNTIQTLGAKDGLPSIIHETHSTNDYTSSDMSIVPGGRGGARGNHARSNSEEKTKGDGKEALAAGSSAPVLVRQGRPPLVDANQ
ncbi:hypothetical protein ABZX51_000004 [Aspergillus tubingensis]